MAENVDERMMRLALKEARKGLGSTSPNPMVGAVLARGDTILAKAHHRGAGSPHAEIECLRAFQKAIPRDATLYVTLEPCSTLGRTPACTGAIVDAGVKNLVIGTTDPNPRHAGRGIRILREAGVAVRTGILDLECAELNEAYNKWIQIGRPFVIAKCAMTLDGRLSCPPGESRWITEAAARRHAQKLRAQVDAILIGAETLRADNPHLTVRGIRNAKQPWRVILSGRGRLPKSAHLFTDRFAERTLVYKNKSLDTVLRDLGRKEITSVLIEGGGDVLGQALDARLVDKVQIYVAPLFAGGPIISFARRGAGSTRNAASLNGIRYERINGDICASGLVRYESNNPE
jgi:diaminohydroxyphosphoribosylaminopyrimidine deaminase / 5-amino-6-(5-phosphoribosylamino)uracil reductase